MDEQAIEYTVINVGGWSGSGVANVRLAVCMTCGAAVLDREQHTLWHSTS